LFNDDEILHDDDWNDDDHVNAKKTGGGKTDHGKEDDVMYQDYYYMDDDDEYEFMEDDAMDDVEIQEVRRSKAERDSMSSEQRKEKDAKKKDAKKKKIDEMKTARTEKSKRRVEEAKSKKEENRRKKREELQKMNEGKPAEKTFAISEEGWYRYCVEAAFAPVSGVEWSVVLLLYQCTIRYSRLHSPFTYLTFYHIIHPSKNNHTTGRSRIRNAQIIRTRKTQRQIRPHPILRTSRHDPKRKETHAQTIQHCQSRRKRQGGRSQNDKGANLKNEPSLE